MIHGSRSVADANEPLAAQGFGGRFTDRLPETALSRHTPQRIRCAVARSPDDRGDTGSLSTC